MDLKMQVRRAGMLLAGASVPGSTSAALANAGVVREIERHGDHTTATPRVIDEHQQPAEQRQRGLGAIRHPMWPAMLTRPRKNFVRAALERALRRARPSATQAKTGSLVITRLGFDIRIQPNPTEDEAHVSLVSRCYGNRGYCAQVGGLHKEAADRPAAQSITVEACRHGRTVGTLTVRMDGPAGLNAERSFQHEILPYRRSSARLCEFNRLAVDLDSGGKAALALLFSVGFVIAHHIYHASDLLIEVNPRHAAFYARRLKFTLIGDERNCPRVNAPAVLLHRSLRNLSDDVMRFAGLASPQSNSFYALGLAPWEQNEVAEAIAALIRPRTRHDPLPQSA